MFSKIMFCTLSDISALKIRRYFSFLRGFLFFKFARDYLIPIKMCVFSSHALSYFFRSCDKSRASGQRKATPEEELFYAFPAAESSNTSRGSAGFILEFFP